MHHLCRIDRHTRHEWRVTIQRRNQSCLRNFSDRRHGGRDQVLAAARAYRDEILAQHPPMTRQERWQVLKKHNQSGVSGVTRLEPPDHNGQEPVGTAYWVARWPGEGKRIRQRRFSVTTYGEWGAYLRAVEARQHGLATLVDDEAA